MNRNGICIALTIAAAAFALGLNAQANRGPVVIDLGRPGDALVITLDGKAVGGLRVDRQGRLGVFGPNQTSTAITLDSRDRVQIDPVPLDDPPARLSVANDAWLTGALRVGRADAFGDAPFDPNGSIQLGRNLPTAQPIALARFFAHGREAFRLGAAADGAGYWSDGAHDVPLVTFRPSREREPRSGTVEFYDTIFSNRVGTVTAKHPTTGRITEVAPK
jgi:hypothetical protein